MIQPPILFRISQEAQGAPLRRSTSPAPMHLNLDEEMNQKVDRLYKEYTAEQNATHFRELPNSDPIRAKLFQRYRDAGQLKDALEVAVDTVDVENRRAQLGTLVTGLAEQDEFVSINRLLQAVQLDKRDAMKFKVGIAYAEKGNFIRVVETYFYIERMEWKNNLFLAAMKHVPQANKLEFFNIILRNLIAQNQIETALNAVKKFSRIQKEIVFIDMANYLEQIRSLDNICLVLNELSTQVRVNYLVRIIPSLMAEGVTEFALKIVEPLKLNQMDPNFYEDTVFFMGTYLISINRLDQIHLISRALSTTKRDELDALIPRQVMHD